MWRSALVVAVLSVFLVAAPAAQARDVNFEGASANGATVVFTSADRLLPADTDENVDLYLHRDGTGLELASTGPAGGNGSTGSIITYRGVSADGQRVFFETREQLTADDTDSNIDIYQRSPGATTRISTGTSGGNGSSFADPTFKYATPSGTTVYFETAESLEPGDVADVDIYSRAGAVTTLVSDGVNGGDANDDGVLFGGASEDGSRVFFESKENMAGDSDACGTFFDPRGCWDVFERSGGVITHATPGSIADARYEANNAAGTRMWFSTASAATAGDTDGTRKTSTSASAARPS